MPEYEKLVFPVGYNAAHHKGIERDQESTEYRQDKKVRKKSTTLPSRKPRKERRPVVNKRTGRMVATFSEEDMAMRPVSVKAEWRIMPL